MLSQVQGFQQWQSDLKQKRKHAQKLADVQDALMAQLAVDEQEDTFKQYADIVLDEAKSRGLPIKPIEKYVNKKQNALMSVI